MPTGKYLPSSSNYDQSSISSLVYEGRQAVDPPDGMFFSSEEMVVWQQVVTARDTSSWRKIDLLIASKFVKLEMEIREINKQLNVKNYVVDNGKGVMVENPLFRIRERLQRQQADIIRVLALTIGIIAMQANRKAYQEEKVEERREQMAAHPLLASPGLAS